MSRRVLTFLPLALIGLTLGRPHARGADGAPQVDFNRDIRPIFTNKCFKCHGPGAHNPQTDLRLYNEPKAFADLGGNKAIVPGKPEKSELYRRITAGGEKQMPPPSSGKKLTDREVELIRRWIAQGADWKRHWSFQKLTRPELPEVEKATWPRNAIDYFVLDRLERNGLTPSPPAEKRTLVRRATLDLTGLPPRPAEVRAFLADESPAAYERLVDRLLASPRFGEHKARDWLDAARYADTHGMHFDNKRSIWPYRDWVVESFNENKPFDEFTVEQLAGDLLPDPDREQLIATGFNRNNITSNEGGSIAEELWTRYTIDRTSTMGTVWLGLSVGCAQCHSHKFDPIEQKEFYQLYAFFYNMADRPMDGNAYLPPPTVKLPSAEQKEQLEEYDRQLAEVRKQIDEKLAKIDYRPPETGEAETKNSGRQEYVWIDDALPEGANPQTSGGKSGWQFVSAPEHPVQSGDKSTTRTGDAIAQHFFTGASPGLKVGRGDTLFAHVYLDPGNPPREVMLQFNDGSWSHRAAWGADVIEWGQKGTASRRRKGELPEAGQWVRLEVQAAEVGLKPGDVINGWAFTQYGGTVYWDAAGIVTRTPQEGMGFTSLAAWEAWAQENKTDSLPANIQEILKLEAKDRNEKQKQALEDYFVEHVYTETRPVFEPLHRKREKLEQQKKELQDAIPATMITRRKNQPEKVHRLVRGAYDNKGEVVQPGVPDALHAFSESAPRNRLGLAKWIVDRDNPLTARVIVNRYWQQYFGRGLVKTAENFGALGEMPTHPKLLDWLAAEFIESGWDIKHLHRLIVTSATYRQSSRVTPRLQAEDPHNKLLARGPHYRLDAEMIRDYALFTSGLMNQKMGGPPVNPYQPKGLWKAVAYEGSNTMIFKRDDGQKLYRRSLYTFWKRTSPPPNMTAFDAVNREDCAVRRERTNTPSQALVLMNDVQFVEAARGLAERIMREGGSTPETRIEYAFRVVLARPPSAKELQTMRRLYERQLQRFHNDPAAAEELIHTGDSAPDPSLDEVELAAWTMVGNAMLNLSETISKR